MYREHEDFKKGERLFQAFEYLKKQGKTRFLSIAQHVNTADVLTACIESGHFDAIQPNFNVLSDQKMHDLIDLAKKHDIGVICKKVMVGGERSWNRRTGLKDKLEKYMGNGTTLGQALIRWALDVPGVHAVVPMINNFEQLDENVIAGFTHNIDLQNSALVRKEVLNYFAEYLDNEYCRSCGTCLSACTRRIPIPDILRFGLYYTCYGYIERAKQLYNTIPETKLASQCDSCGKCESKCPHRLPIIRKLNETHNFLG